MKFLEGFFLVLMIFSIPGALNAAERNHSAGVASSLTKKALENNISNIENELKILKESLEKLETKKKKKTGGAISFAESLSARFMAYLVEKGEGLKEGIYSLEKARFLFSHIYKGEIWYKGSWFWLKLCLSFLCGFGAYFLVFQGLKQIAAALLKGEKGQSFPRLLQLIIDVVFFSLPLLAFALVEISIFFLNEQNPVLRNGVISLTISGICLWVTWHFTHLITKKPFSFVSIVPTDQGFTASFAFWVRGIVFFYIVGGWGVEFGALIGIPEAGQKVLWSLFGFGWTICTLFLIHTLRRPFMLALMNNKTYPFLGALAPLWPPLISAVVVGLYIFWALDDGATFEPFFLLVLMMALGMPLGHFLYRKIRLLRLRYVWRRRHDKILPPFYNILASNVFFNRLSKWVIYSCIFLFIFESWGFEFFFLTKNLFQIKVAQQVTEVLLILSTSYIIMRIGDRVLDFYLAKKQTIDSIEADYIAARFRTILRILRTLLRVGIWIPAALIILSIFNYDTTPLLASVGIITAGLTFGAQSIVKDFLSGFLLILEKSLVVGDQVEIDGKSGTVEDLTLRILRVRMDNGTLLTIPFGNISVIGNKSRYFAYTLFNISVGYQENPDTVQQLLEKAYQILRKTPAYSRKILAPIEVRGIVDVTDYSMVFQARLKTAPGQQDVVKRAYNRVLKQVFDEANMKIPSPAYPYMEKTSPSLTNTVP